MPPSEQGFEAGQDPVAIDQGLKIEPYLLVRESIMEIASDLLNHHLAACDFGREHDVTPAALRLGDVHGAIRPILQFVELFTMFGIKADA
jgi:hypothetical protein